MVFGPTQKFILPKCFHLFIHRFFFCLMLLLLFIHHPGGSVTCNDKKMKVIKRDLSSCVAFSFIFILMGMALNNSEQPLSLSIHHHYSQGKNNSSIHSRSRSFCRDFSSCPFLSEVIHSSQLKRDMSSVLVEKHLTSVFILKYNNGLASQEQTVKCTRVF